MLKIVRTALKKALKGNPNVKKDVNATELNEKIEAVKVLVS